MPLLPKPYPDEVIGSVIARGTWQCGLPLKVVLQDVFGPLRSYSSFLMGTGFKRLAVLAGTDAEELLMAHTVFPYATAFMPPLLKNRLKSKALSPKLGEDCVSSLTKNVSHGVLYRRVCPLCVQDEMRTFGESYWHRQHLLPGALVCLRHGVQLSLTNVPLRGKTQSNDILLPHLVVHRDQTVQTNLERLKALTRLSVNALDWDVENIQDCSQLYRACAIKLGYQLKSGDVAGAAFSRAVQSCYGCDFLQDAGCVMSRRSPWPALMVRPGVSEPFATPKHVLMQAFLAEMVRASPSASTSYRKPGRKPSDFKRLDTRLSLLLKALVDKAIAKSIRCTVKQLLRAAGSWSIFRHHRELFPKSAALLLQFRSSEQSHRQVGLRAHWRKRNPGKL